MSSIASPEGEYEAESYWRDRLGRDFNLVGVGYKALGEHFNRWQYRGYLRNLDRAQTRFGFDLGRESILECGFGTGYFLDYYHRLGNRDFAGVDLTEVAVGNLSGRYPEATFRQANLGTDTVDLGRPFDVATAFAVLLHITDDDQFQRAMTNLCSNSRRWVLISDVFPRTTFRAPGKSHYVLRSRTVYEEELDRLGFEVVGYEPIFALLAGPTPRFRAWFYTWNAVLFGLTRTEFTGNIFGGLFYAADGVLIRALRVDPSIDLLVARRRA